MRAMIDTNLVETLWLGTRESKTAAYDSPVSGWGSRLQVVQRDFGIPRAIRRPCFGVCFPRGFCKEVAPAITATRPYLAAAVKLGS